jgi:hypothetical protein
VKELRLRENAVLFQNYESLLPDCHECYVPGLATLTTSATAVTPDQTVQACVIEPVPTYESSLVARRIRFGRFCSATDGPTHRIVPYELASWSSG